MDTTLNKLDTAQPRVSELSADELQSVSGGWWIVLGPFIGASIGVGLSTLNSHGARWMYGGAGRCKP